MTRSERIVYRLFLTFFVLLFVVGIPAALWPMHHCYQAFSVQSESLASLELMKCRNFLR